MLFFITLHKTDRTQFYLTGNIRGLMGNFNGDPNDDLRTPSGTVLPPDTGGAALHNQYLACRYKKSF